MFPPILGDMIEPIVVCHQLIRFVHITNISLLCYSIMSGFCTVSTPPEHWQLLVMGVVLVSWVVERTVTTHLSTPTILPLLNVAVSPLLQLHLAKVGW